MSRYINQDKVIDAVLNLDTTHRVSWRDAVVDMIDAMPSADVRPVVRCSECANNYSTPHNPMCDYMDATLYPDSFCSKGKPKGVDCTDCIKNGGDWECDHIHCHKVVS